MKNKLKYLITAILAISVFSCELDGVSTKASNSSFRNDKADIIAESENLGGDSFIVSTTTDPAFGEAELNGTYYRTMTIVFEGGQLDLESTNLDKIEVFPLQDATSADALYVRKAKLVSKLYTVDAIGSNTTITFYYDDSDISDRVEIVVANTITADNGTKKLNQDKDKLVGANGEEEASDSYHFNGTVGVTANLTAPTALTTGTLRNTPQATFTLTENNWDETTGVLEFIHSADTSLGRPAFTKESLLGTFEAFTFNYSTMEWEALTNFTYTYTASTRIVAVNLGTLDDGTYLKYRYDVNAVSQATADEGYIRKLNHTAYSARLSWVYKTIDDTVAPDNYFTASAAIAPASSVVQERGNKSVKLVLTTSAGDDLVNASTLTNASVRFFLADAGVKKKQLTFDEANIKNFATNSFEFILDDQEFITTGFTTPQILVEILPTVTCNDTTDTVATDDTHFGIGADNGNFNMVKATLNL